jgi:hypothetical protein
LLVRDVHLTGDRSHMMVRFGGTDGQTTKGARTRHVDLFGLGKEAAERRPAALPDYAPANPGGFMFPPTDVNPARTSRRRAETRDSQETPAIPVMLHTPAPPATNVT